MISSRRLTHLAPRRNPVAASCHPTTTRPSPETLLARLDVALALPPRSTMPVDSSQRNACAYLQPTYARPPMTRPPALPPNARLSSGSHGWAARENDPSVRHSVPLFQIAAFSNPRASRALPTMVRPSALTPVAVRAPMPCVPAVGSQ